MHHPYKIYDASAGSGKTYVLAKEYLKIILSSSQNKSFRQILAITFTNKAVNEMKQRILGSLFSFSQVTDLENAPPLFLDLLGELQLDKETLAERARFILKEILHNYSFFDVSTIDKFTHRLIRTFAKDLKLSQHFEVVLDTDILLDEAVSKLLDKAGTDDRLTKVLIDFALEKIDGDKSWDIAFDLNKIGKLLFDENHGEHIEKLEGKTISDFLGLKRILVEKISTIEKIIISLSSQSLHIIEENRLQFNDFTGSYFPKFIFKILEGDLTIDFNAAWKRNFETAPLYNKSCAEATKITLDALHPKFTELFNTIKDNSQNLLFLKNAYANVVPLSVLNAIRQEIKTLEKERDLLPISSFNTIISNEIKDQPVPFIFERLGEKYRHYFIDEFQDTSEMQWNNLLPLIGNALESEDEYGNKGSLLLVGDAKQAIYRWRGGKAEQFLNLVNGQMNPFVVPPHIALLPKNYRSHETVVKFNNDFFTATSPFLNYGTYRQLYTNGNRQKFNTLKGGLVQLQFIEEIEGKNENDLYFETVLQTIGEVTSKGHKLKDICILTRKKKHGILLAEYLMQQNVPIISSETLLLNSDPKVKFLINLLRYSCYPGNLEIGYDILYFLALGTDLKHPYIKKHLGNLDVLFKNEYNFTVDFLKTSSVYDGLEYAIRQFRLVEGSDAYVTFLMDEVLDVEQKKGANTIDFLEYWENKKGKLSVVSPENVDAVQLMTVHKAKGLEFPIVIFPYANSNIYEEIDPKLWVPVEKGGLNGFEEVLISKKQEVVGYGPRSETIYNEEQHKLELDAFNVLYVALTRAIKALYIITKKDLTSKGEHKTGYYSGLFIHFLKGNGLWDKDKSTYSFGALETHIESEEAKNDQQNIPYQYSYKESPSFKILAKAGILWETHRGDALSKGNLIHHVLGLIKTHKDLDNVFENLVRNGDVPIDGTDDLKTKVLQVIRHPKLKMYFDEGNTIRNERDIITENGLILRPDRLVIQGNKATIIDYKTGNKNATYHQQVHLYAKALEEMDYTVENKIIVYINETVIPELI